MILLELCNQKIRQHHLQNSISIVAVVTLLIHASYTFCVEKRLCYRENCLAEREVQTVFYNFILSLYYGY